MKKILYLHAGAEMYGADKILLELVQNVDKQEYSPLVILPEDGVLVDEMKNSDIDVEVMPYPIVRRKYFSARGIFQYIFGYLRWSRKLARIVRERNIDIIHINTTAVWEGVWLKIFTRSKIVWHVHEITLHPHVIFMLVANLLQHFSDLVVAVSDATRNHLIDSKVVNPDKIIVVHNGIDATQIVSTKPLGFSKKIGLKSDSVVVGMVGRVNAWKGQSDFLEAIVPILKSNENVVALLVGSPYKGEENRLRLLEAKIDKLPKDIRSRVRVEPFQNDVSQVYQAIDVFVMPSTSPDPFPTVVLEAMANSIPVVGYNHGGVKEMIEDGKTGLLVEPLNTKKLSDAIRALIDDKQLRIAFGISARKRQQRLFDLPQFVSTFESCYHKLSNMKKMEGTHI